MKHYTNKELTAILNTMKSGAIYCGIDKYNRGIGTISADNQYIHFQHYGSSAVKSNIDDLRWLLENIFDDCAIITSAVYSEYHINYIPVDTQYKAIDYSANHPNTYGL